MDAEQLAQDLSLAEENIALLEQQLKAAKQRELELLAYSEELFKALWTMPDGEKVADAIMKLHNPSQALREHEANVVAEYKQDAERYHWIRDAGATFYSGVHTPNEKKHHVCEWAMDDAIDAAMAEERRKK